MLNFFFSFFASLVFDFKAMYASFVGFAEILTGIWKLIEKLFNLKS